MEGVVYRYANPLLTVSYAKGSAKLDLVANVVLRDVISSSS